MRSPRWALWVVAVLVAAAAASKGLRFAEFQADLRSVLVDAGLAWSAPHAGAVAGTLVALEVAIAVAILVTRTSRAGLVALLCLVGAGILLVGLASGWGSRADSVCPCGLPFAAPGLRSTFAALLLRDACIVALAAAAWGPGGRPARGADPSPT